MKKIIISLTMAGIACSPLALFAANPIATTTVVANQAVAPMSAQEKLLAKKLAQIKRKSNTIKRNIKTNIAQTKSKVAKVKKEKALSKKITSKKAKVSTTTPNVAKIQKGMRIKGATSTPSTGKVINY